jgi:carbon-monoxide dehydrogenase small subunit
MNYLLKLNVNDQPYEAIVKSSNTLLEVLRDKLNIMSPKCGCDHGDCGACTVLIDGRAYKSCITLALTVEGKNVTTLEGLIQNGKLHPLQQAFHDYGAAQCGYCTPGMIMTSKALLDENPKPTEEEVREALSGNLCRCTGYKKIIDAVLAVARGEYSKERSESIV